MKRLMGQKATDKSNVQSLANKTTNGNVELLASKMNEFFVSVSEHLPRLVRNNEAFDVDGQLPDLFIYLLNIFKQGRTYRRNHCFTMLPCTMKSRTM